MGKQHPHEHWEPVIFRNVALASATFTSSASGFKVLGHGANIKFKVSCISDEVTLRRKLSH